MIRNVGAQMGADSRLNNAVARASQLYHRSGGNEGGGACLCKNGQGPCPGCEVIPIYRTFSRRSGQPGQPGRDGLQIEEVLLKGAPGGNGRGQVVFRHRDSNDRQRYESVFDIRLVDFDVEDENGDGIFEPGRLTPSIEEMYIIRSPPSKGTHDFSHLATQVTTYSSGASKLGTQVSQPEIAVTHCQQIRRRHAYSILSDSGHDCRNRYGPPSQQ